jgi:4-amino-4-deoxy-L-arabinose transferase-like glycosyltransferase
LLGALALLTLVVHLLLTRPYGYFRDELYYIVAGRHLDWGYVDYPPMVAWLAALTGRVLGDSLLALHVLPAIAHATLVVLTGLMARELGGGRLAQGLAAGATLLAPTFLMTGGLFTMDVFDQVWWALAAYLVLRLLTQERPRLWLCVGLVVGFGLLTKMTMLFFGMALIIGLVLTPQRMLLRRRWPWIAALVAVLGLLPYVGWQLAHGWPTLEFYHNYTRDTPPALFVLLQALTMHPLLLPLWLAGLVYYLVTPQGRPYRALGWTYLLLLVVFAFNQAKFYFLAPAYPMLFAAGACLCERRLGRGRVRWLWPTYSGVVVLSGAVVALFVLPALPLQTYVRLTGGNLPQPIGDRVGWPELLATVARVYDQLPRSEQGHTRILTINYGEAAAVDVFGQAYGLPHAISGHNSYYLWGSGPATATVTISLGYPRRRLEALYC